MHSLLRENRVFSPPAEFAEKARIGSLAEYESKYRRSVEDPEAFWAEAASELDWITPFTSVVQGEMGHATWFNGGRLNLCHNAVDRHALGPRRDKIALLWEGEPGEVRRITYAELHDQVQRFANVLKSLGRPQRRSRRHLHGHVPRAGHGAARLRPHRRHPLRYLRRLRPPGDRRPSQRFAMRRRHHAGR